MNVDQWVTRCRELELRNAELASKLARTESVLRTVKHHMSMTKAEQGRILQAINGVVE